jgi:hypothetical protein
MRIPSAILISLLLLPCGLQGQTDSLSVAITPGVRIEADVDSALVFIDGDYAGFTPLTVKSLEPGEHIVRVQHQNVERWLFPVVQDTVYYTPGSPLSLRYRLARRFFIRSMPFGAEVSRGEMMLGRTPLFVEADPQDTLLLRLAGYREYPASVNAAIEGQLLIALEKLPGTLDPDYLLGESMRRGPDPLPLALTGGSALVAGVFSAYFKVQADEAYSEYLATGDPVKRAKTQQLDAVAGVALATATMFLGLFTYLLMSP